MNADVYKAQRVIMLNNRDLNIGQNNRDHDFCYHRAALMKSSKLCDSNYSRLSRPSSNLFLWVQGDGVHVNRRLFFTFYESKNKSDKLMWQLHHSGLLINMIERQKAAEKTHLYHCLTL